MKTRRQKRTRLRKNQRGGYCVPCMLPFPAIIGAGSLFAGMSIPFRKTSNLSASKKKTEYTQSFIHESVPGKTLDVRLCVRDGRPKLYKGGKRIPLKGKDPHMAFENIIKSCKENGYRKCRTNRRIRRKRKMRKKTK
jgi:hypothetical protein